MQTHQLLRAGLYTALCLSTLGLWLGEDNPWPYPWLVVLCAIAAYAFTDHWGMLVIPGSVAPWLGALSLAFFVREEIAAYQVDPVLPLGHLIMFLQMILLFQQKNPRTYWYLLFMSFLLMLIAALHNSQLSFGVLLGVFLALTTWCLTQFVPIRESERNRTSAVHRGGQPALRHAIGGSLASAIVIFAVALCLFLLIPRLGQTAWSQYRFRPDQHLSGFDEQIHLGQLGTILESDEEVMVVHMFDENGQPYLPPAQQEPYWRGIALTHYQDGQWDRKVEPALFTLPARDERPSRYIRQEIRLQAVHRDVLFGLRPMFSAYTRSGEPLAMIQLDGTLIRPETVPLGPLQYTVESYRDSSARQPYEYRSWNLGELTVLPTKLREQLRAYVARLNPPPTDNPALLSRFLVDHLHNPNEFDYTLRQEPPTDPNLDPVLDFLVNRKEGHCEYFASALALMLRAYGVPARVVNGFKGGDSTEPLGKSIVVRQKHAHSWVEAFVQLPERSGPDWITFDPTPGQSRQRMVARVNPTPTALRQMRDLSRQVWSNYVLNFNSSEQEALVYGPIRELVTTHLHNLAETARNLWTTRSSFNWLAAMLASGVMAGFILLFRMLFRIVVSPTFAWTENGRANPKGLLASVVRWIRKWLSLWAPAEATRQRRIAFYDQLLRLLKAYGLTKVPSATPHQFAEHASLELARLTQTAAVARVPAELVDRYYRVRFGHDKLSSPETEEIGRMLGKLSAALTTKE